MSYFLPDKAYQVLKWVGILALPAVATFVATVGPVWGLENVDAIVTTLNACGVLIGILVGASHLSGSEDGTSTDASKED